MDVHAGLKKMVSSLKDPVSGLTHFVGALLSLTGLCLLLWKTSHPFNPWSFSSCIVFGMGLILLYTVSTLYHWLPLSESGTVRMKKLDHIMIFVLIAATYTPFCLGPFRGRLGWITFACIWGTAALGTAFKLFWIHAPRWVSTVIYVSMGWLGVAGMGQVFQVLEPRALFWLVSGGVLYSVGALIYAFKRPDPIPRLLGFHEIFHVFVMLGSAAHFWTVYRYVTLYT